MVVHSYIEIPIRLPTGVTCTVDVLGNPRLRVNLRDLTPAAAEATTHALIEACDDINRALPSQEAPRV